MDKKLSKDMRGACAVLSRLECYNAECLYLVLLSRAASVEQLNVVILLCKQVLSVKYYHGNCL